MQKKTAKITISLPQCAKKSSAKLNSAIFFSILGAVAKTLRKWNSKHPHQKLGFHKTLILTWYIRISAGE